MTSRFSIRLFHPHEWREFKAIRLEALEKECGKFGASLEKDAAKPDEDWQNRLTSDGEMAFFCFVGW